MRIWLSGPRVAGIRLGVSLGPEDFRPRRARGPSRQASAEPIGGSFVYVITDGHRVKVGSSIDPNRRLRELQSGNPRPLQLIFVAVTPGTGFDIELRAHDMLASYAPSAGGTEWYDTTPEIAAAAVMGAAGTIGQKLLAISPNQIGQILQIARAGSATAAAPMSKPAKVALEVAKGIVAIPLAVVMCGAIWFVYTVLTLPSH